MVRGRKVINHYEKEILDLVREELIEELPNDNFAIDFALSKVRMIKKL